MIDQQTIDKILDATNIVDVINEFVPLKRKGTNYVGVCPFHSDKNPSLSVSPSKGIYKCFSCGEGGGVVQFLMKHQNLTYTEALKWLADKYHIEVEEKPMSDEEKQQQLTREAMFTAMQKLSSIYVEEFQKDATAQKYAHDRWGVDFCKSMDIGFCPSFSRLVANSDIPVTVAKQLGLTSEKGYDVFSGRIIIPIRNRVNHIIGFTARLLGSSKDSPKYINSSESLIYSKSRSIFGINTAWNEACRTERFYLVEGAPDCMRLQSIGVLNAVATLGTAWTDEHFAQMKKAAKHLCFLPDADPPKPGEDFGPGIKAVIKSGKQAIKAGFSVSVKQIEVGDTKQDPDTYCTDRNIFNGINEKDFVIWYADLLFKPGMTTDQQSKSVMEIADILTFVQDDTTLEMYISQLTKYVPQKNVWRKSIEKQNKEHHDAEVKAKAKSDEDMMSDYNFGISHNKYYSYGDKGYYEWSNFVMQPLFHIKDSVMPKRIYMLKNTFGKSELVELKQEDLVSLSKFKQKVEGLGNFIWMAGDRELTKLKSYLYEKTETAVQITQLGWQREEFYAFGNGVFFDGSFLNVDEYGIVRLNEKGNFYLPALSKIYRADTKLFQFERKFVHLGLSSISLKQFSDQIFRVFGNNGKVGFCFFLATLFRDLVTRETRSFPILNLFGPKGSGKSELGHTLMSFFIVNNVPPNIQNSTNSSLNETVAAVANALVHIDEFKNDIDIFKREFLKGLWDGTGRTRMNMDLDKKKETTAVDSGIILSGQEMATADIALFSRLIFLSFPKSEFTSEEKAAYQELIRMRSSGMTHLTIQILQCRSKVEKSFHSMYQQTYEDVTERLKNVPIEDRILLNWLSPLAILRTLESSLSLSISYKEMLEVTIEGIRNQNGECRQNNELASFWNMVAFLASEGELVESGDYRIQYFRHFSSSVVKVEWSETRPVLYIQKSRIFMLYKKHGKAVGDTLLPEGSLKYYLENSKAYLGEKTARYDIFHKGIKQFDHSAKDGNGMSMAKTTTQRSYCFDYLELVKTYDINLERSQVDEPEEPEEKPDPRPSADDLQGTLEM